MNTDSTPREQLMLILQDIITESVNKDIIPSDPTICKALLASMPVDFIDDTLIELRKDLPSDMVIILDDMIHNE